MEIRILRFERGRFLGKTRMNRSLAYFLFLFAVQTLFTFCLSALPKEMPSDFYVRFYRGGGMRPEYTEIYFDKDISYVKERKGREEEIVCFRTDPELLKNLYESIRKNRFDRIETRTEKIYDRGGESVQVGAEGETYNKSDSGMTLIQPFWKSNWKNVLDEIQKLKQFSAENVSKNSFSVSWKNFQEPLSLNISSERRSLLYRYQIQPAQLNEFRFFFLPGKYKLYFEFQEDKAKFHRNTVEFEIDKNSKPLSLHCNPDACVFL